MTNASIISLYVFYVPSICWALMIYIFYCTNLVAKSLNFLITWFTYRSLCLIPKLKIHGPKRYAKGLIYKLTRWLSLYFTLITVHTKEEDHENIGKYVETQLKEKNSKLIRFWVCFLELSFHLIKLPITNFGDVGYDRLKEIKSENWSDDFSFWFPDCSLTEGDSIAQKSL